MNPLLNGAIAAQRRMADIDHAAAHRLLLDLRRSNSTRAAVARAEVRLDEALARREAQEHPLVTVMALAP